VPYWYHGCVRGAVDLGDLLAIAEQVLGVDAHVLKKVIRLGQAESALAAPDAGFGGEEFYPDPAQKAAILCSRIIRNHPLPDGNKRVAFLSLLVSLDRQGLKLTETDQDHIADTIEQLAAREMSEEQFVAWVGARVAGTQGPDS
jgi:death on curing protein